MGLPDREPVVKAGDIVEGRYRIISTLGEGGMGTVYLAEHTLIKRRVAIKILHPELATDANIVERFMNEARAAGTLGHPNIVESTDMGFTHNQEPYIVFEYLEGALLTDEIYRVSGMPVRRAIRIAQQIASALDAAHNAGIIHRDLKCDNVFLTDKDDTSDHVKVLDFGISRFRHVDEQSGGLVMGTPEYMAPEQISDPDGIDHRADIYGLGVMLYEMLTARRPFKNEDDPKALMQRVLAEPPPPLGRADVPHALGEMILGRMLAKSPDDRFQSMVDVEMALDQFTTRDGNGRRSRAVSVVSLDSGGTVTARRIKTPPPRAGSVRPGTRPGTPVPAPAKRPLALYALAGAGVLVGVIGLVVGMRGGNASAPPATPVVPIATPTRGSAAPTKPVEPVVEAVKAPEAPRTVEVKLAANALDAKVAFRRRTVKLPTTLLLAPNAIIEMVEVSAPDRKTVRYWLTLDRATTLSAKLPKGKGVVEATDEQTLVALGELDESMLVAEVKPEKEKQRAHARSRTGRRVGRSATEEPPPEMGSAEVAPAPGSAEAPSAPDADPGSATPPPEPEIDPDDIVR